MKAKFVDAQQMNREYPEQFKAPAQEALNALEVGHIVKVCDALAGERFWAIVKQINGDVITAEVDNLISVDDYGYGDEIVFEKRHVYDTMDAEGMESWAAQLNA